MALSLPFISELLMENVLVHMSPGVQLPFFHMSHIYDKNKKSRVKDQCEK